MCGKTLGSYEVIPTIQSKTCCLPGETIWKCAPLSPYLKDFASLLSLFDTQLLTRSLSVAIWNGYKRVWLLMRSDNTSNGQVLSKHNLALCLLRDEGALCFCELGAKQNDWNWGGPLPSHCSGKKVFASPVWHKINTDKKHFEFNISIVNSEAQDLLNWLFKWT